MEEMKTKIKKDLFRGIVCKEDNRKTAGITLIALVITVVILIILAGVLINISLGNNGLLNKAKTAKEQYVNAQDYEDTEIAKITNNIDSYVDANRGTVTISEEEYNAIKNKGKMEKIIDFKYSDIGTGKIYDEASINLKQYSYYIFQVWDIQNRNIPFDSISLTYDDIKLCNSESSYIQLGWGASVYASAYYKNDNSIYASVANGYMLRIYGVY